jgi:hypothetical protein
MRVLVVLAFLGGCAGSTRPGVLPQLSELPGDPQKRDAVLDSAGSQPGPEHRKPLPPKLHKAETAAATAAAVIGSLFSKTKNVTIGVASPVDENRLFAPPPPPPRRTTPDDDSEDKPAAPPESGDAPAELVPWIRLKPPADR